MSFAMFLVVVVAIVIVALGIIGAFIQRNEQRISSHQLLNLRDDSEYANYGIAQAKARLNAQRELDQRIKELSEQQKALRELKKYI